MIDLLLKVIGGYLAIGAVLGSIFVVMMRDEQMAALYSILREFDIDSHGKSKLPSFWQSDDDERKEHVLTARIAIAIAITIGWLPMAIGLSSLLKKSEED